MPKLKHEGYNRSRLSTNPRERIFAEHWLAENTETIISLDSGSTLGHMLNKYGCYSKSLTQKDCAVAATVIQWLGSEVGMNFLASALKDAGYRLEWVRDAV